MIHYVLGHSGAGKTRYCLEVFDRAEKAVFFIGLNESPYAWEKEYTEKYYVLNLTDEIAKKSLVNLIPTYRQHLNKRIEFSSLVYEKIMEAKSNGFRTIFLDEFQLYYNSKLVDFILENGEINFWIIHQWPGQLEAPLFNVLYGAAGKKYLLDPYPKEEGYNY